MVTISCSGKFHAFALAEQLQRRGRLDRLFTAFASQKNTLARHLVRRIDQEQIPVDKIHTNLALAVPIKAFPAAAHRWNDLFDRWVARSLGAMRSQVFIGWSGMSLHSLRRAKRDGLKTILERGSSHIEYQNEILKEEYKRFGMDFAIHPAVIEKELAEYQEADFVSVPSTFVKNSFLAKGIDAKKLFLNHYGAGDAFAPASASVHPDTGKLIIVYLGALSIQKGLIYLFEALKLLDAPESAFEVWFIGSVVDRPVQLALDRARRPNWRVFGHIDHYQLGPYLSQCDVGVQPSLQEGLSMVIPQLLASGVPMVVSANSGGADLVTEGDNGFVVPIRDPQAIADKLSLLFHDRVRLRAMKQAARASIENRFTWDHYGLRYADFLASLT